MINSCPDTKSHIIIFFPVPDNRSRGASAWTRVIHLCCFPRNPFLPGCIRLCRQPLFSFLLHSDKIIHPGLSRLLTTVRHWRWQWLARGRHGRIGFLSGLLGIARWFANYVPSRLYWSPCCGFSLMSSLDGSRDFFLLWQKAAQRAISSCTRSDIHPPPNISTLGHCLVLAV